MNPSFRLGGFRDRRTPEGVALEQALADARLEVEFQRRVRANIRRRTVANPRYLSELRP